MPLDEPRNQHVVTEGYLRFFAEEGRVSVCDKPSGRTENQGVRKTCAEVFFNTKWRSGVRDHAQERTWGEIERVAIPTLKAVIAGEPASQHVDVVKQFIAMHMARSYTVRKLMDEVFERQIAKRVARMEADADWSARFASEFGRMPEPGDVSRFARVEFEAEYRTNNWFVDQMNETYHRSLEWLQELHCQTVRPIVQRSSLQFVTSDNPVVLWEQAGLRVGFGIQLSTSETEHVMLPVSPEVSVLMTHKREGDLWVAPEVVQRLNSFTWRNAHDVVIAHPSVDWRRSILGFPQSS